MERCKLVFDIATSGFPFIWWPVFGGFAIVVGYLVFRAYRAIVAKSVQLWQLPLFGLLCFSIAVVVFTMYLPGKAYLKYQHVLTLMDQGTAKTVKGTVAGFRAYAPDQGSPRESFAVCGVAFSYDPNAFEPGYRVTNRKGSPVQNGTQVRITYVDDTIARLENMRRREGSSGLRLLTVPAGCADRGPGLEEILGPIRVGTVKEDARY